MHNFLNKRNRGFARRFDEIVEFPDWSASDCTNFLRKAAEEDGYKVDAKVNSSLLKHFQCLHDHNPRQWSNAADAATIYKKAKNNGLLRGDTELLLTVDDFKHAFGEVLRLRPPGGNNNHEKRGGDFKSFNFWHGDMNKRNERENNKENKVCNENAQRKGCAVENEEEEENQHAHEDDLSKLTDEEEEALRQEELLKQAAFKRKIEELQSARKMEEERRRKARERLERQLRDARERREKERLEHLRIETEQMEAASRREIERLRRKEEAARRIAMKHRKVLKIGRCSAGFGFTKVHGGWRCNAGGSGRGSHFVSDSEVASYMR